jgi:hypothetical protein
MAVGGQRHVPATLTQGNTVPIVQEAGCDPGSVWTDVIKGNLFPPPGFEPRTFHSVASRYKCIGTDIKHRGTHFPRVSSVTPGKFFGSIRYFRPLPRCQWDVRSSGILRSENGKSVMMFGANIRPHLQGSWTAWPLKTEPTGYPETSVRNFHSTLRRIPKKRRSR